MVAFLVVVAVVIGLVLVVRSKRFRSRIRMIEGAWGFVRLWPNPGIKWKGHHWCRHYGRKVH